MSFPDPTASRAVLVGVSRYSSTDFDDIPAVAANVTDLHALLTDTMRGTFDANRCLVIQDPPSQDAMARPLMQAANEAEDVFLVYYAGHGIRAGAGLELYLALADSGRDDVEWTGFRYHLIREAFQRSRATTKIVILDCCYSGAAAQAGTPLSGRPGTAAADVIAQVEVAGSYVLTATSAYAQAMALAGATHTAFTGELITALRDGVAGVDGAPRLQDVYVHLCTLLGAQGLPIPQQSIGNTAGNLTLMRFPASTETETQVDAGEVPVDVDKAIREINAMGQSPGDDGQAALAAIQRLVRTLTVARGANHPDTLNARIGLLHWTGWAGEGHAKALAMAEQLVADAERETGRGNPLVFRARLQLSEHASNATGPETAVGLTRELVADVEAALGHENVTSRQCLRVHAMLLAEVGQPAEAASCQIRVIGLEQRLAGAESATLPGLRQTLADYLGAAGEPMRAAAVLRTAVDEYERLYGPEHRETLECREDLAYWLDDAEQYAEAVPLRRALLADMTRVLGAEDELTAATHHNLARGLAQTGSSAEAAQMYQDVVELRSRLLGPEHEDTLASLHGLALSLGEIGEAEEAARLLQELVDLKGGALGPDHPETLDLRRALARQTEEAGFPRRAMEMSRSIIDVDIATYGMRNETTLLDRIDFGCRAQASEDWETAVAAFEALIDDVGWAYGRESRDALMVRFWHAESIGFLGDTIRAADLMRGVLKDQIRALGEDDEDTEDTRERLVFFRNLVPGPGFRMPMPPF